MTTTITTANVKLPALIGDTKTQREQASQVRFQFVFTARDVLFDVSSKAQAPATVKTVQACLEFILLRQEASYWLEHAPELLDKDLLQALLADCLISYLEYSKRS